MSDLTDFLLARIAEDEEWARPKTVGTSGGSPGPLIPNCFECYAGAHWALDDLARQHVGDDSWYRKNPEAQSLVHEHEWTHADARQLRQRADIAAKRRIVERWRLLWEQADEAPQHLRAMLTSQAVGLGFAPRVLAETYASHPDFREEWRA